MDNSKKVFKGIGIALFILIVLASIAIDVWFIYVNNYAPKKIIENTYEIGMQETTDGDKKHFIEVRYNSNENNNGYETLDIKLNYMLDETENDFYSQGIQFVAGDENEKIDWQYLVDDSMPYVSWSEGSWYNFRNNKNFYGYFGTYFADNYNYSSSNDYETSTISTNEITDETSFKIQLGDELYKMKFKGSTNDIYGDENLHAQEYGCSNFLGNQRYNNYYYYQNIYSFAYKIYQAVQSLENGTKSSMIFEFCDMFDYYKYDAGTGQYSSTAYQNIDILEQEFKSYYAIYVEKVADGARKASDSLFNAVAGNANFNITGETSGDDYFVGKNIINCNIYSFEYVLVGDNYFSLKLNDAFMQAYSSQAGKIALRIEIDLDELKKKNINFYGFTNDSGLDKFEIVECYTLETINDEVVKTEVDVWIG